MVSVVSRRMATRGFAVSSPPQSPLLTSTSTIPSIVGSPLTTLRLSGSVPSGYRTIVSSSKTSLDSTSTQAATAGDVEYDGYAELLQFGHRMRWQPHAMVKPTNDCNHGHLTRGSEDTARLVPLRDNNEQPVIVQ